MKKESLNNQLPGGKNLQVRRRVKPARTELTDQALPPDGHIEPHSDDSDLFQGLWPEATKKWFVWNEDEKPRAIKVAVNIEKLCGDYNIGRWWREQVKKFVAFKADYDNKKFVGKYVDPSEDWPFDPDNPRELSLPGDLPALYALLGQFHDWMVGFDQIFSEENAVYEFLSDSSHPDFEQRPVRIKELETFLEHVKKDIKANQVCWQAENLIEEQRTLDKAKEPSTDKDDSDEISHSKDFRSVTWHGRIYSFNKNQAVAIGLLWNAMERGEGGIHQNTIGESLDTVSKTYRLLDTFRQHGKEHPAWKEMIHHLGHCIYTLNKPV